MAIDPNPYRCDMCGTNKQESNHWFLGLSMADDYLKAIENQKVVPNGFVVIKWDAKAATTPNIVHICGVGCAARWLTAQLQTLV